MHLLVEQCGTAEAVYRNGGGWRLDPKATGSFAKREFRLGPASIHDNDQRRREAARMLR